MLEDVNTVIPLKRVAIGTFETDRTEVVKNSFHFDHQISIYCVCSACNRRSKYQIFIGHPKQTS